MKKAILATTIFTALSVNAFALTPPANQAIKTMGNFYAGIQLGSSSMSFDSPDVPSYYTITSKTDSARAATARIFGGYLYNITNKFQAGAELGNSGINSFKYKLEINGRTVQDELKISYVDFLGVAKYNFAKRFNVLGKAGVAYVLQKETLSSHFVHNDKNKTTSNFVPKIALGINFDINKNISLDLTYAHVFGSKIKAFAYKDKITSIDSILLGATYRFVS